MADKVVERLAQQQLEQRLNQGGAVRLARSGDDYTVENIHRTRGGALEGTLRRVTPKPSKAERKAAKRAKWRR